jgi:hypothetical protein
MKIENQLRLIVLNLILSSVLVLNVEAQSDKEVKPYNNFTFYYLDNSVGNNTDPISDDLVTTLKINLNKLKARNDNYFLLYACNGNNYRTAYNLNTLLDEKSTFLQTYFSKPSKFSDYDFDKKTLRDNISDNPIKIKQNIELNFYLSANAIKNMTNNIDELPTQLLFPREILIYLNSNQDVRIKINIFTNKTENDAIAKLKDYFNFCNEELKINVQTELIAL